MLVGAHESIAGGVDLAPERAAEDGCEVFQIFTSAPGRWEGGPVSEKKAAAFRENIIQWKMKSTVVHGAYLINPASPDRVLWKRSLKALVEEYLRCAALGAEYLVIHPGSHRGKGADEGVLRVVDQLDCLLDSVGDGPVVLLENTAGAGNTLGSSFDELNRIRDGIENRGRVAFCLDTAHAFAAGYDLSREKNLDRELDGIGSEVDIGLIRVFHLNDTLKPLGSRVDRHTRVGEGILGLEPFRYLMNCGEFRSHPGIIETPPEGEMRYAPQLVVLKNLRDKGSQP